jgi:hypothetical protein
MQAELRDSRLINKENPHPLQLQRMLLRPQMCSVIIFQVPAALTAGFCGDFPLRNRRWLNRPNLEAVGDY